MYCDQWRGLVHMETSSVVSASFLFPIHLFLSLSRQPNMVTKMSPFCFYSTLYSSITLDYQH